MPVAVKLATVALPQKTCVAEAVGAVGIAFTVSVPDTLVEPFQVPPPPELKPPYTQLQAFTL